MRELLDNLGEWKGILRFQDYCVQFSQLHLSEPPHRSLIISFHFTLRIQHRAHRMQRSHIVHVLTEEPVLNVRVLDLAVGLHVVASRELLAAHRTLVALRPMDVGVMPAIRDGLVTADATVQRRKRAGQLDEQRRVVDVVIATRRSCRCSGSSGGRSDSNSHRRRRRHGSAGCVGRGGSGWCGRGEWSICVLVVLLGMVGIVRAVLVVDQRGSVIVRRGLWGRCSWSCRSASGRTGRQNCLPRR